MGPYHAMSVDIGCLRNVPHREMPTDGFIREMVVVVAWLPLLGGGSLGLVEQMPVSIFSLQLVIAAQGAQDIGRWLQRKRRHKVNPTGHIGVNRTAIACPPDGLTLSGQ